MHELDLTRHAVLEASAGTGKTYALEQIVLRLVRDQQVPLEKILLVTFTEKAASELQERLRSTLQAASQEDPGHANLAESLRSFDRAIISTIHGFCQRALREFSHDLNQETDLQLVHDSDLFEPALREVQRRIWRQHYGADLAEVLTIAGYGEDGRFEGNLRELILRFKPEQGHRLLPAERPGWVSDLPRLREMVRDFVKRWRDDLPDEEGPEKLLRLRSWLLDSTTWDRPVGAFCRLIIDLDTKRDNKAFVESKKKGWPSWGLTLLGEFEELRQQHDWLAMVPLLQVETVADVRGLMQVGKRERGLQSYDDMVAHLEEQLDPQRNPQAPQAAARLRERFQFGIIDEFQDTDPLQWNIFRRIFLEGDASRLIVVGDPKQAIYQFRGADLDTYLEAVKTMAKKFGAGTHQLDTNWRTCSELIGSLNRFFGDGNWFPADEGIQYTPVKATDKPRHEIVHDLTGRPAFCPIDWRHLPKVGTVRRQHARFIAAEIRSLLTPIDGQAKLRFRSKDQVRDLTAGDCCVLVMRRLEAEPLEKALRQQGLASSFYRKSGLWQSDEAMHLRYVMEALAHPEENEAWTKALFTQFFRLRPEEVLGSEDLSTRHPARQLFQRWLGYAESRRWAQLFQSLLEDTGVMLIDPDPTRADRRRANLRFLAGQLEQAAYRDHLDILGLVEICRHGLADAQPGEDVEPRETERDRVRIMTMHAAKGLEFPIVFILGGLTQSTQNFFGPYRDTLGRRIWDLEWTKETKDRIKEDQLREHRRLLYVAFTRAMFKLYVPVAPESKAATNGPTTTMVKAAIDAANFDPLIAGKVLDAPAGKDVAKESTPGPDSTESATAPTPWRGELFPALPADLGQRSLFVRSFSSLHRKHAANEQAAEQLQFTEREEKGDEEIRPAPEPTDPLRGPVFGEIVHNVFEQVDFAEVVAANDSLALLRTGSLARGLIEREVERQIDRIPSRLSRVELRDLAIDTVAKFVHRALTTRLTHLGCRLGDIPAWDRLSELEFHFPDREGTIEEGHLTGFIDLIVRRGSKIYLIDWKTNALPGYGPTDLQESMRSADYIRQYRLYLQALVRWLRRGLGAGFDVARDLAGVYYLYVRGLNGLDESAGVWFHHPQLADLRLDAVLV